MKNLQTMYLFIPNRAWNERLKAHAIAIKLFIENCKQNVQKPTKLQAIKAIKATKIKHNMQEYEV